MRIASGAIVKSQPMRQTLLDLGMESERILISASGANAQLFHSSAPGSAPPVFLAVGRFVDKKGPLFTIRAFAQLVGQHPRTDLALWMVGEGPLQQQAKALVRELGLESVVRFWGAQPQQKVAELMREARGFVQHSVVAPDGDSEGNPVAVMEAQLSGLPVVATRHAGIPEVVRHGESGWQQGCSVSSKILGWRSVGGRLAVAGFKSGSRSITIYGMWPSFYAASRHDPVFRRPTDDEPHEAVADPWART
jgi:glycosyltransferase involved in cell wall biosynthesis